MARQHNELFNIEDCFNHLWYMSDPVLRKQAAENVTEEEKEDENTTDQNVEKSEDDIIFESLLAANENENDNEE